VPSWFNPPVPNSTFATQHSPFDAISSPGTPGTPWQLDNPSILIQTPPELGAPKVGAPAKEKKDKKGESGPERQPPFPPVNALKEIK
jgi:hypothetical protein